MYIFLQKSNIIYIYIYIKIIYKSRLYLSIWAYEIINKNKISNKIMELIFCFKLSLNLNYLT